MFILCLKALLKAFVALLVGLGWWTGYPFSGTSRGRTLLVHRVCCVNTLVGGRLLWQPRTAPATGHPIHQPRGVFLHFQMIADTLVRSSSVGVRAKVRSRRSLQGGGHERRHVPQHRCGFSNSTESFLITSATPTTHPGSAVTPDPPPHWCPAKPLPAWERRLQNARARDPLPTPEPRLLSYVQALVSAACG